jgi:hypothetical protein
VREPTHLTESARLWKLGTNRDPGSLIVDIDIIYSAMKHVDSTPNLIRSLFVPRRRPASRAILAAVLLWAWTDIASAADFSVTSPGFFYSISGLAGQNPTLNLIRGKTYTFAVSADAIHPFLIKSAGVVNNNISSGTITFTVPNVVSNYAYICSIHGFGGTIKTVAASTPPPIVHILGVAVNTNIVLTSTGTNGWGVFPEFVTNVSSTDWSALVVKTNRFLNGTNETICGKPPADAVYIRIRSQSN